MYESKMSQDIILQKWCHIISDMMHTYYDKHFFEFMPQGAPNFSWRIKKSDHQRNSISDGSSDDQGYRNSLGDDGKRRLKPLQPRRPMRPFFKPRSLKTTGSCHWILCSTRRKCNRIVGTNTFPKLSYRQGNLLKGIDNRTVRRYLGNFKIVPSLFTYVLFSVTHSL